MYKRFQTERSFQRTLLWWDWFVPLCTDILLQLNNYQNIPLLLTAHSQIAQHLKEEAFALWKIDCHSYLWRQPLQIRVSHCAVHWVDLLMMAGNKNLQWSPPRPLSVFNFQQITNFQQANTNRPPLFHIHQGWNTGINGCKVVKISELIMLSFFGILSQIIRN